MSRVFRVALAVVLLATVSAPALRAQTADVPSAVRVFTVRYADGRTTKEPVRDDAWDAWTPAFPRIAGAQTESDGLRLAALQFEHAVNGRDLVVTIALLYGEPHQKRVPVTSVRLTDGQSVRVDELANFGVQPITVGLESLARPPLPIPDVTSPSGHLAFTVEPTTDGIPAYRILIANHAQQAVMALAFEAYHGKTKALAGRPHAPAHAALIAPGDTYTMTLTISPRAGFGSVDDVWLPIDRIVFSSVTWSDGIIEGSERPAAERQVVDDGIARELARALELLRAAQAIPAPDLTHLRSAVSSLSIDDDEAVAIATANGRGIGRATAASLTRIGMQIAKDGVLKELDDFLSDPRSGELPARQEWLASAVAKFDGWRNRIVTAPR